MKRYTFDIGPTRWGVEKSTVPINGAPYLTRWILYFGVGTLRLHKFWRGDDDRASHTHPWWFITFPLAHYRERIFDRGTPCGNRFVSAFRFHFRPANYEHIVVGRLRLAQEPHFGSLYWTADSRPFYTIVLTGGRAREWGFYPTPGCFINWREYK